MSFIQDIVINISRLTKPIQQAGFGLPLILGESAPFFFLDVLSGEQGLKWKSRTRGTVFVEVVYVDPGTPSAALSVVRSGSGSQGDPYIITANLATDGGSVITSTAADIKTEAENTANVAGGSGIVDVTLLGTTGNGVVTAFTQAPLAFGDRFLLVSANNFAQELLDADYDASTDESKMVSAMFAQSPAPQLVAVFSRDAGANITTTLDTLRLTHDEWFFLLINNRTKSEVQEAGTYANNHKKIFVGSSSDLTVLDNRNLDREGYLLSKTPGDFPDAAWVGRMAPTTPGSATWKWKELNGQNKSGFNTTELTQIRNNQGQALTEFKGKTITNEGVVTSGEFIDIIRGQDKVQASLEEELFLLFTTNDKIPLDDTGISQVVGVIKSVLKARALDGIIAAVGSEEDQKNSDDKEFQFKISAPTRAEISQADRAARNLPNVEFTYVVAGAIHKTTVTGAIIV